ncbi:APC amino acid permease [Laccaria bicolor S238N-H82]|uniref:APC amino acid permease n=1 Tax=Laccaria bicolor (strain S238N-H82 / ATCC MYA-4686) TaxID=486041 RepID=B0DK42_LACBS|nr:APC amino acid permease [Laccaria bicolor S238N-H82]EDR05003.1 APC amino acid permease [Laccaria bicolor S238N-H82]|eukprot:XP_001884393.1 APC amino acid permease [Laccaria bicolor S238N-H82]
MVSDSIYRGNPSLFVLQQLHRSWHLVESFAASFCALNFIGGVRSAFFLGLLAGGPAAIWSSYLITLVFMTITAWVLAEICSALPLSGSIYIWSAESAGPKYARFFGFIVAWWACTAWMTFVAGNCQTAANYIVSQLAVWEVDFPGGVGDDNVKWRALIWAISEGLLVLSVVINYLPPRLYSAIFKFSVFLMMLDFFLCVIWLPIGVSKTYGFRSAKDVFTQTYNGTGAPAGWNWILSFPAVNFALEKRLSRLQNTSIAIVAASRLVFAVARDGVMPGSKWISQVDSEGQPKNAVTVIYIFAACLLCTILPSQVAFYSLVSAGGVPTIAAYGLIALLRLTMTPDDFKSSYFFLGRFRRLFYFVTVLFSGLIVAVMLSPFFFPVNAQNFNFACVIFGAVTVFGVASWYFTPEEKWLRPQLVAQALKTSEQPPVA